MAPLSSRKLEMRPLSNAVKNVSGMQVSVCRDVENLEKNQTSNLVFILSFQAPFTENHSLFASNIEIDDVTATTSVRHFCVCLLSSLNVESIDVVVINNN